MIALLIAFAPLLGQLGLTIIDWFVKDKAANEQAKRDYQAAIDKHKNDGAISADQHNDYQAAVDKLKAAMVEQDKSQEPKS